VFGLYTEEEHPVC